MKSDFKEVFNSFDENYFDDDFMNLSDIDVCDDTAMKVDVAKIKADVFKSIEVKKKKKKTGKNIRTLLVAAMLVIGITVFSTVIYASGSVQLAFGDFFGGNMNFAGLYSSTDVSFTSDDPNLDVQLLGITGDESTVYVALEAKRRDGKPITDEGFENVAGCQYNGSSIADPTQHYKQYGCVSYFVDKDGNRIEHINGIMSYSLSDDRKLLRIMFLFAPRENDLKGETLIINSNFFKAKKTTDSIAQKKKIHDVYDWDEIYRILEGTSEDTMDYRSVYNGEYYDYCKVENKRYSLPFEMKIKVNLGKAETIKHTLTHEDAPNFITKDANDVTMEISSFGLNIKGSCDMEVYEKTNWSEHEEYYLNHCYEEFDYLNSRLIMNDGTMYYLYHHMASSDRVVDGLLSDHYEENFVVGFTTYLLSEDDVAEIILVDPNEIKSIIINGDTVYHN